MNLPFLKFRNFHFRFALSFFRRYTYPSEGDARRFQKAMRTAGLGEAISPIVLRRSESYRSQVISYFSLVPSKAISNVSLAISYPSQPISHLLSQAIASYLNFHIYLNFQVFSGDLLSQTIVSNLRRSDFSGNVFVYHFSWLNIFRRSEWNFLDFC